MSITKPFTFVAGTKARANEVNADFDTLYTQVNSNISAINANANNIDNLESNKANINGSTSQVFKVADPVVAMDAVNKQSLTKAIGNSINYIDGYVISKDSGSPNDTILVTVGSCYDYSKTVVLAKNTSTTKQNASQGASTTYYVYVIGNDSGSSVDILISSNAVVPALPEGYTKFRQIGCYTTDSSSNISSISYYGTSSKSDKNPSSIIQSLLPDWSRAINLALSNNDNLPYAFTRRGWFFCGLGPRYDRRHGQIYINNVVVTSWGNDLSEGWNHGGGIQTMVSKGDVLTANTNFNFEGVYIVPFKGDV